MEIIDNFLPEQVFRSIQTMFYRSDFPWYWCEEVVYEGGKYNTLCKSLNNYQLFHTFYNHNERISDWNITPILRELEVNAIVRSKANLNTRTKKIIKHGYHIDIEDVKCKTAIYYINTNDGFTEFETGEKVESIENRVLIFDSDLMHTGTTCTNQKRRIVLNLNYF